MRIIGGKFKGQKIAAPPGLNTRPTSSRLREALFNICQNQIEGACFLDLFAGSGALGLEALSRGAKSATFVEVNRNAIKTIQTNIEKLGVGRAATLYPSDVFRTLDKFQTQEREFDLIWADPPYEEGLSSELLHRLDKMSLLQSGGLLFIEEGEGALDHVDLKTLKLESTRSYGKSSLYLYRIT